MMNSCKCEQISEAPRRVQGSPSTAWCPEAGAEASVMCRGGQERKTITMETKAKITKTSSQAEKMVAVPHSSNINHSTVATVLKDTDKIMGRMKLFFNALHCILCQRCLRLAR